MLIGPENGLPPTAYSHAMTGNAKEMKRQRDWEMLADELEVLFGVVEHCRTARIKRKKESPGQDTVQAITKPKRRIRKQRKLHPVQSTQSFLQGWRVR